MGSVANTKLCARGPRPSSRPAGAPVHSMVIFEGCFTAAAYLSAAPVLRALAWPAVIVANFLAAAVMAGYLWWRHRSLQMEP